MSEKKVSGATLRISRVIKAPAERVYNAFLDPDALAKWLPPGGYTAKVYKLEAKVGGSYRMSFTSLDKKDHNAFGGKYLELTPHSRIKYTDAFETDNPALKGEMVTTITFREVKGGTEVSVVQEGIPKVIPLEMAQLGWSSSFRNLAELVEMPDLSGTGA
jgi:uncharacterized protein YndB with AHSA1/START domain